MKFYQIKVKEKLTIHMALMLQVTEPVLISTMLMIFSNTFSQILALIMIKMQISLDRSLVERVKMEDLVVFHQCLEMMTSFQEEDSGVEGLAEDSHQVLSAAHQWVV